LGVAAAFFAAASALMAEPMGHGNTPTRFAQPSYWAAISRTRSGCWAATSRCSARSGAAAGMWLYDQFSGNHSQDRGNDNLDDNESRRRDSDYSSSGDSFSDDSSRGDSGGGDSGGGDF